MKASFEEEVDYNIYDVKAYVYSDFESYCQDDFDERKILCSLEQTIEFIDKIESDGMYLTIYKIDKPTEENDDPFIEYDIVYTTDDDLEFKASTMEYVVEIYEYELDKECSWTKIYVKSREKALEVLKEYKELNYDVTIYAVQDEYKYE